MHSLVRSLKFENACSDRTQLGCVSRHIMWLGSRNRSAPFVSKQRIALVRRTLDWGEDAFDKHPPVS